MASIVEIVEQFSSESPDAKILFLDDKCRASRIPPEASTAFVKLEHLERLSLSGLGLVSLENFPALPALRQLALNDNKLVGDLKNLTKERLPNVACITICGNPIATVDELAPLSDLPNLRKLDLYGCPVSEIESYREKVFDLIPNLQVLDSQDRDGNDVESEDEDDEEEEEEEDDDEEEEEEEEGDENDEDNDEDENEEDNDEDENEEDENEDDEDENEEEEEVTQPSKKQKNK